MSAAKEKKKNGGIAFGKLAPFCIWSGFFLTVTQERKEAERRELDLSYPPGLLCRLKQF